MVHNSSSAQQISHPNNGDDGHCVNISGEKLQSEMHHQFQNPIIKKPAVTRVKRLEQFLWHEFYEEYIRSKERLDAIPSGTPTTEYTDEYGKLMLNDGEIDGQKLARDHPLYGKSNATAITFWNPKGQVGFGKQLSITLPISEQREQFG